MPEPNSSDIEPVDIKIYMLTKLTPEEEKTYLAAITAPQEDDDGDGGGWVRPSLVHWTSDADGTVETDLLRLYKQRTPEREGDDDAADDDDDDYVSPFCFFADRRSVEEGGTILVDKDEYALGLSEEAREHLSALVKEKAEGLELSADELEGLLETESVVDEMMGWAVAWGREPGSCWRSSWMNLDIANMGMGELVEYHGGEVRILRDPEWDSGPFLGKLKEELEKMREEERGEEKD